MRKSILALSLYLLLCHTLPATEPPLTPTQIARLESLCRVWGTVKFFHPWIVAPPDGKPIDWDAALIETIPLVEKATSSEDFRAAIDHLLSALHDPATNAILSNDQTTRSVVPNQNQSQTPRPPPAAEPALPETKLVERGAKKILVVTATDWARLAAYERKSPGDLFVKPFAEAADKDAIVLDMRRPGRSLSPPFVINTALTDGLATLIKTDLPVGAFRSRFHSGYAPEQGFSSGGYHSGFSMSEAYTIHAKPGPSAGKPLIVLINSTAVGNVFSALQSNTGVVGNVFSALQSIGQAIILHAGQPQLFLPRTYAMELADGVTAGIRTTDSMNADGTIGLTPDIISEGGAAKDGDTLMATALAIAGGEKNPPVRTPQRLPAAPARVTENTYPEMTSPSREYRLLGLFRVWNVMHYFFPYKHLMDRSWDSVLTEFIPRFSDAETVADYGVAAREFVAHLQDSHVSAYGGAVNASFAKTGFSGSPYFLMKPLRGGLVVTAVDESVKDHVRIGDTIVKVDGESIEDRLARFKTHVAASTPQSLEATFRSQPLNLSPLADNRLTIRASDGTIRDETLPKPAPNKVRAIFQALRQSVAKNGPTFSILPEGYGYFDLVRLTVQQVNEAFEAVKDTSALIMDMRGYPQGTAWAICSRLTEKPMTMATIRRPYWTSPDSDNKWIGIDQPIQPSSLWKYTKPIVVLINETAVSQSEHSCLGFEEAAKGRITFIGTPTAGANGDVTNTSMPGGIRVSFSGHDIRHADGRQLQRVGIQPDIRVEPTIAGIAAGKDEVLAAAIKFLNDSAKVGRSGP